MKTDPIVFNDKFTLVEFAAQGHRDATEKVANAYKDVAEALVLYLTHKDEDQSQMIDLATTVALTKAIRSPDSSNDN